MLASAPLTHLEWPSKVKFFLVVFDHRGPFFRFDKRVLSGHGLSKKVWPWKVTVSRSNEQGRICPKKSDVFIPRSLTIESTVNCNFAPPLFYILLQSILFYNLLMISSQFVQLSVIERCHRYFCCYVQIRGCVDASEPIRLLFEFMLLLDWYYIVLRKTDSPLLECCHSFLSYCRNFYYSLLDIRWRIESRSDEDPWGSVRQLHPRAAAHSICHTNTNQRDREHRQLPCGTRVSQ